ncbi:MAG TPA: hypothetical protein VKP67_11135 [Xanthobacteraceae bacterium]|nr:hypothetical protein [Xanthobacteraceae bacterium]
MNSETPDFFGWIVPVAATLLAIYSAIKSTGDSSLMLAAAVVLLAWVERRRAKIVTAGLIRIVDEKGGLRGLVGWNGEGIQIGVRSAPLDNLAWGYACLWKKAPSVAFTFQYSTPENAFGELNRM